MSDNTQHRWSALRRSIYNHIWFPKDTPDGYLFRYGMTLILGFLILPFFSFTPQQEIIPLLIPAFLFLISLATLLGNTPSGLILTSVALFSIGMISYQQTRMPLFSSLEIFIVGLTGCFLSVIIPYAKKLSVVTEYNKREKQLEKQLALVTEQKLIAEQEIKLREEFISIASHELKTPLTTTLLKLQTALHNVRNVSLAKFSVQNLLDMLESAEQQTQRLSKMINDLLNVSLIRTGRLELELEECDIAEITRDVVKRFIEKAERENTPITLRAEQTIKGICDRVRIEQVVANLLSNAMKYGKGNPILVSVIKKHDCAVISIQDNGIGIPKEDLKRIFALFERAVHSTAYKGLGIGLYITNQIVKAHHGKIDVKSEPEQGSEFIVEIPL